MPITPWTHAFQPKTLDDLIGHASHVHLLKEMIRTRQFEPLLFYGKPGLGKSSAAQCYKHDYFASCGMKDMNDLSTSSLYWVTHCKQINASDHRTSQDLIHERVLPFATQELGHSSHAYHNVSLDSDDVMQVDSSVESSSESSTSIPLPRSIPRLLLILEEADNIDSQAQEELHTVLDQYGHKLQLILVVNDVSKIIASLRGKCMQLEFQAVPKEQIRQHLQRLPVWHDAQHHDEHDQGEETQGQVHSPRKIVGQDKATRGYRPWTDEALDLMIESCHDDIRHCLSTLSGLCDHLQALEQLGSSTTPLPFVQVDEVRALLPYSVKLSVLEFLLELQRLWIELKSITILNNADVAQYAAHKNSNLVKLAKFISQHLLADLF